MEKRLKDSLILFLEIWTPKTILYKITNERRWYQTFLCTGMLQK